MAVFGNQPRPTTLKEFSYRFNIAHSNLYLKPQTDEYEVNRYLVKILHARKIFAVEDDSKDPYAHFDYFNDMCETFKLKTFCYNDVELKLFSYTLLNNALIWYKALFIKFKDTWKDLSQVFLAHYYPMSKTNRARHTVAYFKNRAGEIF
jgi:hypothetical protein